MDKFLKLNLEYKRWVSHRYNCISDLLTVSQCGTWVSWVRLKLNMEDLLCGLQRIQLHPCGKINEHRQRVSLPTSLSLSFSLALTLPSFHCPGLCICVRVWPFRPYNLTCPSAHSAFSGVLIFCCCAMLITPAAAVGRLNCLSLRQVRRFGVQLWQIPQFYQFQCGKMQRPRTSYSIEMSEFSSVCEWLTHTDQLSHARCPGCNCGTLSKVNGARRECRLC